MSTVPWVWVGISPPEERAGFSPCFHFPGLHFGCRCYVHPQPLGCSTDLASKGPCPFSSMGTNPSYHGCNLLTRRWLNTPLHVDNCHWPHYFTMIQVTPVVGSRETTTFSDFHTRHPKNLTRPERHWGHVQDLPLVLLHDEGVHEALGLWNWIPIAPKTPKPPATGRLGKKNPRGPPWIQTPSERTHRKGPCA